MPTQNFDLTASAWTLVGAAPCTVEAQSSRPVAIYVGTEAPAMTAAYAVLRADDDDGFPVTAPGHSVWARGYDGPARIAVSPSAGGGGGSGDASAANQQAQIALDRPVQGVIDMPAAATPYTAGRAVEIVCSTTGTLTLTYADGSTRTRKFVANDLPYRFPDAVTQWSIPNGSAFAGTLCNLK